MKVLVGSTGLVGSALQQQTSFDKVYHSQNIQDIATIGAIDDLYLSCFPATKWLVNQDPLKDLQNICAISDILTNLPAWRITLFSTIDVYHSCPPGATENTLPFFGELGYGANRLLAEELILSNRWARVNFRIVRLPALFHPLFKKNILFDLLNNHETEKINANSAYQWYPLKRLWRDIDICGNDDSVNLFPPPIETTEIMQMFFPGAPINMGPRIQYDHRTLYTDSGYFLTKEEVLSSMEEFINAWN